VNFATNLLSFAEYVELKPELGKKPGTTTDEVLTASSLNSNKHKILRQDHESARTGE